MARVPARDRQHPLRASDEYVYETLPPEPYIRCLLLDPGEGHDPLSCKLLVTNLNNPISFEAVSYVWGTQNLAEPITCDGKTLYITVNLRDALRQARNAAEPRALWSDSICINQRDNVEKAHQVHLMADIYRKSICTLICLGPNDDGGHAQAAATVVADVNQMMDGVFQRETFTWEQNIFPFPNADDPLLSDPRWEPMASLADQPWFRRVWVIQEAALGPVAEILWAGVRIEWLRFLRAYFWIHSRAVGIHYDVFGARSISWLHLLPLNIRLGRETVTLHAPGHNPSLTLLQVLDCGRVLGATDPRDRIYACLSLPHSTSPVPSLRPDYIKSHVHIYHDFACKYLESSRMDLDLLLFTQNFEHTPSDADCPSWVPRWDVYYYTSLFRNGMRRYPSRYPDHPSSPCLIDRKTLKVRGLRIGSVRFALEPFYFSPTPDTFAKIWQDITAMGVDLLSEDTPFSLSSLKAFVTTLAAGNYRGTLDEWEAKQAVYIDYLQEAIQVESTSGKEADQAEGGAKKGEIDVDVEPGDVAPQLAEVHNTILHTAHNRKLVVSDRGYFGLAPFTAREGDAVYIIFGAKAPCLLRPADPGYYKLVGDIFMLSSRELHLERFLRPLGATAEHEDWTAWKLGDEEDILLC